MRNKINAFRAATKTRKALFLTMVTAHGVANNAYCQELVNNRVEVDSLFAPNQGNPYGP